MNECLSGDSLIDLGSALDWNVAGRLRHLEGCEECRARLEELRLLRSAFVESEAVEPLVVNGITASLAEAARRERRAGQRTRAWIDVLDPIAAGTASVVLLVSSGIPVESLTTALLGFAAGATLMLVGKLAASSIPGLIDGGQPSVGRGD